MSRKSLDDILNDVDETEVSLDKGAEASARIETDDPEDDPDANDAKAAAQEQKPEAKAKDDPDEADKGDDKKDGLPPWMHARVKAATEARAAAERRAQELEQQLTRLSQQPQQEQQPTLESYLQQMQMQTEQRLYQMTYAMSRNAAIAQYGAEEVAQAEAWAYEVCAADPQANQRFLQSQDPIGQALAEYRKAQTFAELEKYGGDLNKLIEAKLAERASIQTDERASPQVQTQKQKMPGNFSGQPSAQTGRSAPAWGGPKPLSDLLNN